MLSDIMNVNGKHYRTIGVKENNNKVIRIIDQRNLPHEFIIEDLTTVEEVAIAIKDMHVRASGLIGAATGYGMYIAALEAPKDTFDDYMVKSSEKLKSTRPTAVNLAWAVKRQLSAINKGKSVDDKIAIALKTANDIADEDADFCKKIGEHGLKLIEEISKKKKGDIVNILTHCNAGWLAFVDWGSATAPIYAAFDRGIKIHVWVDETRPRNQGARLTAWELNEHGVPHTVIADNTGGHLMQHKQVDIVIVGTDRTTYTGDVANKIGTYLKALAAKDNNIPFYVTLPSSTFDWTIRDGIKDILIEKRDSDEVRYIQGLCEGKIKKVLLTPEQSPAANYAFDVTPARLVTGLITERGICAANKESILNLYPEQKTDEEKGYIKFNCNWIKADLPSFDQLKDINEWRDKLYKLNMIGAYKNGIGFGNISVMSGEKEFIITGSATGNKKKLNEKHYTKVVDFDFDKNCLTCIGPIIASSESLSHAAVYTSDSIVGAVVHIHNLALWKKLKDKVPTTSVDATYGTPEMAKEIMRLFKEANAGDKKIIVMGGHKEGILCFGKNPEEAGNVLLDYCSD